MDCPQELETSLVTVALVAGSRQHRGVQSPQGLESLRFPPFRPQATVITEPHVRWPATIYILSTCILYSV